MRKKRRIITLLMAICFIFVMNMEAFAAEAAAASSALDYSQTGSITVDVLSTDTGKAISGGVMTLYKVAIVKQVNGNPGFELTDAFKESKVDLTGITESDAGAKELASKLASYVNSNKLAGQSIVVDKNGQAVWKNLELGVYLVMNTTPASGYQSLNTFLITVPRYLDGVYVYDVTANPKVGTANASTSSTATTTTTTTATTTRTTINTTTRSTVVTNQSASNTTAIKTTTSTTSSTSAATNKLPQTGQLWWPVPILALTGIVFLMFGWYRRRQFREDNNVF